MCKLCEIKPVYEFTNQRKLCKTCFVRWFQKKVLYTIRRFGTQGRTPSHFVPSARTSKRGKNLFEAPKDFQRKSLQGAMIKSGGFVGYENKGDVRGAVLEDVLKMFAERARVELIKLPTKKKLNKIAISSTTDLEADKIIHALIKGKEKLTFPKEGKIIKPLYLFLDKEVFLYAKLKNLAPKGVPSDATGMTSENGGPMQNGIFGGKIKKDNISKFIDELEKTHPEVKQAVVGSWLGR